MGKKLIIKGADFSVNAFDQDIITFFGFDTTNVTGNASAGSTSQMYFFYQPSVYAGLSGLSIKGIKVKLSVAGKIKIVKCSNVTASTITDYMSITNETFQVLETINLVQNQELYNFNTPVVLGQNEILGFMYDGTLEDRGNVMYFTSNPPVDSKIFVNLSSPDEWRSNGNSISYFDFII